jgi:hypothetical protein
MGIIKGDSKVSFHNEKNYGMTPLGSLKELVVVSVTI